MPSEARFRAAVDIGGTFTDFVLRGSDGRLLTHKVSSTTDDYGRGIVEGLRAVCARDGLAPRQVVEIVHGTTVAANTILEGKGARTALVTTRGFRDVLELRRVRIAELYNLNYTRSPPLVPRRLRFEVAERMNALGEPTLPLDESDVRRVLHEVARQDVEALAVCLLHSYANPAHEQRIEALAREVLGPGVYLSCSWHVLPEIQEYERCSTTAINACLGPVIGHYARRLRQSLDDAGFDAPIRIMQSSGGILTLEEVLEVPARMMESGPAAGVIGAATAGLRLGTPELITVDMGGTTAKAALVEGGRPGRTNEYEVGAGINVSSKLVKGRGHALKLPVVDISEIGAGGGSIARVSGMGTLAVGPDSAGAVPGPACYGSGGTAATLTDAMVVLGYLNPQALVGGELRIDGQLSRDAVQSDVAGPLALPLLEAAHGVYLLAATTMTRAVKAVSTFRGRDPRDFTLFAFGGNGPLLAGEIAAALDIRRILLPPCAGLYSAVGLLAADVERDASRTWLRPLPLVTEEGLGAQFDALQAQALARFPGDAGSTRVRWEADLRYHGQAFELTVECPRDQRQPAGRVPLLRRRFIDEHRRTYGHGGENDPIDLVTLRVIATATPQGAGEPVPASAVRGHAAASRRAFFGRGTGAIDTPVVPRAQLRNAAAGPLIVEEVDSTLLVPPGWRGQLGDEAFVVLERA